MQVILQLEAVFILPLMYSLTKKRLAKKELKKNAIIDQFLIKYHI